MKSIRRGIKYVNDFVTPCLIFIYYIRDFHSKMSIYSGMRLTTGYTYLKKHDRKEMNHRVFRFLFWPDVGAI